jgi:hypothetical protein
MNIPDHDLIFKTMSHVLSKRTNDPTSSRYHYVALLRATHCNNIKNTMRTLIEQFTLITCEETNEVEVEIHKTSKQKSTITDDDSDQASIKVDDE